MGASLLIPSLLVNCTLSSLAKSPNQCCKLFLKSPGGRGGGGRAVVDNKIFKIYNLGESSGNAVVENC